MSDGLAVVIYCETSAGIPLVRDPAKPEPKWKLPGGRGLPNEHPLEAACREFKEETGLTLLNARIVTEEPRKDHTWYLVRGIAALRGIKDTGDEGEEVCVFSPREFRACKDLLPPHRRALEEEHILQPL